MSARTQEDGTALPVELERHYTPVEVAKQWGVSVDTVPYDYPWADMRIKGDKAA